MTVTVMKFGRASITTMAHLQKAADRIIREKETGTKPIVVVSPMGRTVERLASLARDTSARSSAREMDALISTGAQVTAALLSLTLNGHGAEALSLSGRQAGLHTDMAHGQSRITSIDTSQIRPLLDRGKIVVVAGGQGVAENGEITLLGCGGSAMTAVALSAAFAARRCEIYTSVAGVFTADPRYVKSARKLKEIGYDEMLEIAYLGTGILHPRAIEYAKEERIELVVRSSFSDEKGTVIKEDVSMEKTESVKGLAFEKNVAKVTLLGLPNHVEAVSRVFDTIAEQQINIDVIVQNVLDEERTSLSFTVDRDLLDSVLDVLRKREADLGFQRIIHESGLAKVSIVGSGMASNPGVAAAMFHVLSGQKIKVKMISTSEIKVSTIINEDRLSDALNALHEAFHLSTESIGL